MRIKVDYTLTDTKLLDFEKMTPTQKKYFSLWNKEPLTESEADFMDKHPLAEMLTQILGFYPTDYEIEVDDETPPLKKIKHYLYCDEEWGEFIVDARTIQERDKILEENGIEDAEYEGELDENEYQMCDLDVF